jgi:hypothetical protein
MQWNRGMVALGFLDSALLHRGYVTRVKQLQLFGESIIQGGHNAGI